MPSTEQNILVLSPHPDDETFGCGGALALLAQSGAQVDVAFITSGEKGTEVPDTTPDEEQLALADTRREEARRACEILRLRPPTFLEGQDGKVASQPELAGKIRDLLAARSYRRIFCPGPQEAHTDHLATFQWLKQALRLETREVEIWLYEVWTPIRANMFVPIDSVIEVKRKAMAVYASQNSWMNYVSAFDGLAAYRSLFCNGSRYAEAFLVLGRTEMVK